MNKISFVSINEKIKKCGLSSLYDDIMQTHHFGVCHCHNWDHGYETRYGFNGVRREFYFDMYEILSFIFDFINYYKISEFIVFPWYDSDQFVRNAKYCDNCQDIYDQIRIFLKNNNVHRHTKSGLNIPTEIGKPIVEMIVEGGFRGISVLRIFFESCNTILDFDHHFGVNFWTDNLLEKSNVAKELLQKYPNLKYYEVP